MPLPHPIPDELAELVVRRFRLLAEVMRIRILDRLRDGESTVGELADALDTSQQNVSKHLAVLAERSEEHTSELQSHHDLVCRLLLETKKKQIFNFLLYKKIKKNK